MTALATKIKWSAIASLVNAVGRFIASVVVSRQLGPTGLGQLAYALWLIEIVNVITSFGLPNSLTRFLADLGGQEKLSESKAFEGWVFRRYWITVTVGSLLLALAGTYTSSLDRGNLTRWLIVGMFISQGLAALASAQLTGRQRFDVLARLNALSATLLVMGLTVGVCFFGLLGAMGGYIVGAIPLMIFSFSMLKSVSGTLFLKREFKTRVWKYAIYTWIAVAVSACVWSRIEIFFIERYWSTTEVAMFTVGLTLASLASQGPNLLIGAFLPHFAELCGAGNREAIARVYSSGTRLMGLVLFPLALGTAAITPVLLPMLYGQAFAPAVPNAMVLVALSCLGASGIGSSLLHGLERTRFIALGGGLGAAMSLTACTTVIPTYGAWGAAWVRVIVQISMIALAMWYIAFRLGYHVPIKGLSRILAAAIGCALTGWLVLMICPAPMALPLAVALAGCTYLASIKVVGGLNVDDANTLRTLVRGNGFLTRIGLIRLLTRMETAL